MGEHDTRIMRRAAPTCVRHRIRQTFGETDSIRQLGEQQCTGVTRHSVAVTGHLHLTRRPYTVHLGSALLGSEPMLSTSTVSPARRASSRTDPATLRQLLQRPG